VDILIEYNQLRLDKSIFLLSGFMIFKFLVKIVKKLLFLDLIKAVNFIFTLNQTFPAIKAPVPIPGF